MGEIGLLSHSKPRTGAAGMCVEQTAEGYLGPGRLVTGFPLSGQPLCNDFDHRQQAMFP